MLRRLEMAGWRPYGSKLLLCVLQWAQTRSMSWPMLSSIGSRKVEQFRSRCQEEMKEGRNCEEKQEQGRASQQSGVAHARLSQSSCTSEQFGA